MTVKITSKRMPEPPKGVPSTKVPEPVVEIKGRAKVLTFFSRYREDHLVMEPAYTNQVGQNRWVTVPAKEVQFRDRAFVTNDPKKIKFLRGHPKYGREIFEHGVLEHAERILETDDSGRILALERLGRLGKIMESRHKKGLDE